MRWILLLLALSFTPPLLGVMRPDMNESITGHRTHLSPARLADVWEELKATLKLVDIPLNTSKNACYVLILKFPKLEDRQRIYDSCFGAESSEDPTARASEAYGWAVRISLENEFSNLALTREYRLVLEAHQALFSNIAHLRLMNSSNSEALVSFMMNHGEIANELGPARTEEYFRLALDHISELGYLHPPQELNKEQLQVVLKTLIPQNPDFPAMKVMKEKGDTVGFSILSKRSLCDGLLTQPSQT